MASPTRDANPRKVGSDPKAASQIGGRGDFGVKESDIGERTYTSMNTKAADPGSAQARAGSDQGRTSGVSSNRSGVGSGSGGDVDADYEADGSMIGSPTGRGPGADDTAGDASRNAASGNPARGDRPTTDQSGGRTIGLVDDESATTPGRGAASTNTGGRDDDSFAGELSSGEASGDDN